MCVSAVIPVLYSEHAALFLTPSSDPGVNHQRSTTHMQEVIEGRYLLLLWAHD